MQRLKAKLERNVFRDFTDEEAEQIKLVQAHQETLIATAQPLTELLVCMARNGVTVVGQSIGSNAQAGLSDPMLQEIRANGGCMLIHNHPSEGSLSYDDWNLVAGNPGIDEIVAINSSGSIFRGRALANARTSLKAKVKTGDVAPDVGQAALEPLWKAFNVALQEQTEMTDPTGLEKLLSWVWSHLVNEQLKALGLVEYEATLSETDGATLSHSSYAPIIAAGQTEVKKRV